MMIKLDLEKAYDRLNWNFLKDTLHCIGLSDSWVNLIMNCTQSNELRFLWNEGSMGTLSEAYMRYLTRTSSILLLLCSVY